MTPELLAEMEAEYRRRNPRSAALAARAAAVFPGGSTRASTYFAPFPVYVERADGMSAWDADGSERLDFLLNYTALIHGHNAPPVVAAVARQLGQLSAVAAPTELEVRLAELIAARLPSVRRLRFTNSGTEASALAVRAARAFTGRDLVGRFVGAYHGSHELSGDGPGIASAASALVLDLPFNDFDAVERVVGRHAGRLAAVVVEPVIGEGLLTPRPGFLRFLKTLTERAGALLIFDEVITFRLSPGGAQGLYGVAPDLTVLGKVIGGGLPIGAFGGREDLMATFDVTRPGSAHHAGTFNGYPLGMAAGIAALGHLRDEHFPFLSGLVERLASEGSAILRRHGVPIEIAAVGSLFQFEATPPPDPAPAGRRQALLTALHLGLMNAGVMVAPSGLGCVCTATTQADVSRLLRSLEHVASRARGATVSALTIEGESGLD